MKNSNWKFESLFFLIGISFIFLKMDIAIAKNKAVLKVSPSGKSSSGKREEGDFVIEKRGETTVKYKKKTAYDFEGSSIDGMYNKPSGSYISNIKDVKAKSIIRIRENFDAEVVDSERLLK